MNKVTDEQIQEMLAKLKDEPDINVPADFSVKLISALQAKRDRTKNIFLYTITAILIGCGIFYFTTVINSEIFSVLADTFYRFRWIGFFTIAVFLVILFGDPTGIKRQKKMIINS